MGDSYTIRLAVLDDIDELEARMRPADRAEVIASHGRDVRRTLERSIGMSTHCCSMHGLDGALWCITGVAPVTMVAGIGSPWMLGTTELDAHPRPLARGVRWYLGEVAQVYPVLENYVDVRNTASIKLLKWLGCSFDEPRPYGVMGLPFMRFEVRSG